MSGVAIDGNGLDRSGIEAIARGAHVSLSASLLTEVARGRQQLDRAIEARQRIYGVTTGYGPLAGRDVDPSRAGHLQRHLVYHLATGTGPALPPVTVRAIMAVRLNTLAQCHSAVRPAVLEQLAAWLNDDLVPIVPARGTVGASGDLTPLAHIALALMGEADVWDQSVHCHAADALAQRGWAPLAPEAKDALGLVNGTAAMTGIAALNGMAAGRAVDLAMRCTVAYAECMGGHLEAWHPGLGRVRPHPGQQSAHAQLAALTADSQRLITQGRDALPPEADGGTGVLGEGPVPQDPYTVRCAPQVMGAVLDALRYHDETVDREINAVTDNPVFFPDDDLILQGGNFYGQHVAFVADAATSALVKLGLHAERCVARITDEVRNGSLPAFLRGGATGLNSGLMGAQVSASALIAEMRSNAHPAAFQSVPTNADNQDVVSMGTIAARKTADCLTHLRELQAITAITMAQAVDHLGTDRFSTSTLALRDWVRETSAPLTDDRPLSGDIQRIAERLADPAACTYAPGCQTADTAGL